MTNKETILVNPCIHCHVEALWNDQAQYLDDLNKLVGSVKLSQPVKSRILVALHVCGKHDALTKFLKHCDVVDIVKALTMLDRPRRIRQFEAKIKRIECQHPHLVSSTSDDVPVKRRAIDRLRKKVKFEEQQLQIILEEDSACSKKVHPSKDAVMELLASASVSGALSRKIRKWAQQHKADFLEFAVLKMPLGSWKDLADLVHFKPADFALPYFLSSAHGQAPPSDSFVAAARELVATPSNQLSAAFRVLAERYPQVYLAYAFLRTEPTILSNPEISTMLACKIPLGTAIWYLEELAAASREIPEIVRQRLKNEDLTHDSSKTMVSFGKLLERILMFQSRNWPLAQDLMGPASQRLSALTEQWSASSQDCKTVVFGDASSSMTQAIQAATILATMVSVCWNGELCFFHSRYQASPHPRPSTVEQALEICRKIRAQGCTSLAAALWPYYKAKQRIDRIVLVSDEVENTACHGHRFGPLLSLYKKDVNPNVKLIVITVGAGCRYFRQSLLNNGIEYKQVEIDGTRPDLTKFDSLLGQLALESAPSVVEEEAEEFVVV